MNLKIDLNLDNAAFAENPGEEVARILRAYIERMEIDPRIESMDDRGLKDFNGNTVGFARVTNN